MSKPAVRKDQVAPKLHALGVGVKVWLLAEERRECVEVGIYEVAASKGASEEGNRRREGGGVMRAHLAFALMPASGPSHFPPSDLMIHLRQTPDCREVVISTPNFEGWERSQA